jgi:hypothetical protein
MRLLLRLIYDVMINFNLLSLFKKGGFCFLAIFFPKGRINSTL